jgi:hypothetical protein
LSRDVTGDTTRDHPVTPPVKAPASWAHVQSFVCHGCGGVGSDHRFRYAENKRLKKESAFRELADENTQLKQELAALRCDISYCTCGEVRRAGLARATVEHVAAHASFGAQLAGVASLVGNETPIKLEPASAPTALTAAATAAATAPTLPLSEAEHATSQQQQQQQQIQQQIQQQDVQHHLHQHAAATVAATVVPLAKGSGAARTAATTSPLDASATDQTTLTAASAAVTTSPSDADTPKQSPDTSPQSTNHEQSGATVAMATAAAAAAAAVRE